MFRGVRVVVGRLQEFSPTSLATSYQAIRGEKTTTNLVGLDFDPNARDNLVKICNEVLHAVKTQIPVGVKYRENLESTIEYKLKVLELNPDNGAAEEVLGFQLEQEIKACEKELSLIPKMAEWKPWETSKSEVEEVPYDKIDEALVSTRKALERTAPRPELSSVGPAGGKAPPPAEVRCGSDAGAAAKVLRADIKGGR
eukprot:CAMPEP_0177599546 /NCGR_PEP_ID=MMETSP0419_2-20121207/13058_1 /TAXON_ID=582737 /ORGANISM="Tetraselmis sp., Strain GSL018" /LENGTH=197 /DNA_ID=CAMNT_0019092301 /DNA_START=67 /DNA_END=661 /DNA_ORIENTATION=-